MGDVIANLELKPESKDVDLDNVEDAVYDNVPENVKVRETGRDTIAFGLEKLIVQVELPDSSGGTDEVEEAFREIEGVKSVTVEGMTR